MWKIIILLFFCIITLSYETPDQPELTFENLYKYGKRSYTDKDWNDCVGFMLRAIEDYHYYRDETLWCREKCEKQVNESPAEILSLQDHTFVKMGIAFGTAQKALCLLRCRIDKFTEQRPPMANYDTYEEFQDRKPYHYLQFCYWKLGDLKNAVKSAFTFLIARPGDAETIANLDFYREQKGFDRSFMIDALQMDYERLYMSATQAYEDGDWLKCVEHFDLSLNSFFKEEKKCRMMCEDYLDWGTMQGDNPEMSIVMTSIYTSVLRCKTNCVEILSKVNGHKIKNFLSSYFEYLHVCQFNLQRGRDAAQSVANSLLLDKSNIVMRRNRLFYASHYEKEELFQPSENILEFYKRSVVEKRFIKFVDDRFRYVDGVFVDDRFRYVDGVLPTEQADDRKPFSVEVDLIDEFDYNLITQNILSKKECKALHTSAELSFKASSFIPQLIDEISIRIKQRYGSQPSFHSLSCQTENEKSGCERGAFVISVDEERCSAIL
uniref:Uncharacterized protein n=1 Tax=Panagrolaimus sp. PS1159 TaxID=55785 RepID=A0AC35FY16_9BILA